MAPPKNEKTKYDAVLVDPDIDTRMRLKSATTSVHQFGKVSLINSLKEGLDKLSSAEPQDVVFVSFKLGQTEITEFIKSGKASKAGMDAAFVLVVGANSQDSSTVTTSVMMGTDGILFEPYSVDQLVEITNLAAKVKKERSTAREGAALKFLINDMINQIDLIAYLKSCGYDVGRGIKRFKEMCHVVTTLEGPSKDLYINLAVNLFEEAPIPKKIFQKSYGGASSRIKKKMEQKLLAELENGTAPTGEQPASPLGSTKA